ncbi:MAG: polysaccharide biosynthesis C-terminal domain-containing protein [Thermoanaerobaculia bacterium]|nr:polysaccharide biosynthesis C-terminal domain-containing protein [Thermoanaerobaculia bacterium]
MPPGPGARRAILVSTLSVLAGSGVALAGSLVVRILMARALEPDALGLVLLAIAVVTPVGAIAGLGTNGALAQRLAELRARGEEAPARRIGRRAILLVSASGLLAAFLLAVLAGPLALLLHQPEIDHVLLPMAPVALGLAAGAAALGVARGFGDSLGRALVRDAGGGLLRVAGVGAALLAGAPTSFAVAAGFAAGSLLAELLFVGYVAGKGWLAPSPSPAAEPVPLPDLRPFAANEVLTQATLWLDVVVLGALAPAAVVGLYGVARGLTRVLDLVRQASSHGYLPAAAAVVARGEAGAVAALHVSTRRFAFALVWPILAACILAPGPLLGLLFGPDYEAAAPALRLLALASFLSSFFDYLDLVLLAERRPADVLRAGVVGIAALVALLAALVPPYGGEGAALALLGSSLLRGFVLHRFAFRSRPFRPFLPAFAGPALLGTTSLVLGAIVLRLLRPAPLGALLLAVATGGAAAAVALVAFFGKRAGAGARPASGPDVGASLP